MTAPSWCDRYATHAITEVAAGGAIAFLESDRPDGPRVGDLHSDRAHPRDAVVLAPTSKQTRGGTVSERFCLIAAPAVDPALLLPPSAGAKRKPFPGAECEVDGWAWAIAATRRSPAAPPRSRESGRVASGRSSAVLARSRRGPASTGCTPLASCETRRAVRVGPALAERRMRGRRSARVPPSLNESPQMSPKPGQSGPHAGDRARSVSGRGLWVVEGVPVVMEVSVRSQEPGLEIGQAVCGCFAQHAGWILE